MRETSWFGSGPASVTAARRWVRTRLDDDGVDAAVVSDVELCVSELAANAVRHARTDFAVHLADDSHGRLNVSVEDLSTDQPERRSTTPLDTAGRGLAIVAAVSSSWGVDEHTGGKSVWFVI